MIGPAVGLFSSPLCIVGESPGNGRHKVRIRCVPRLLPGKTCVEFFLPRLWHAAVEAAESALLAIGD